MARIVPILPEPPFLSLGEAYQDPTTNEDPKGFSYSNLLDRAQLAIKYEQYQSDTKWLNDLKSHIQQGHYRVRDYRSLSRSHLLADRAGGLCHYICGLMKERQLIQNPKLDTVYLIQHHYRMAIIHAYSHALIVTFAGQQLDAVSKMKTLYRDLDDLQVRLHDPDLYDILEGQVYDADYTAKDIEDARKDLIKILTIDPDLCEIALDLHVLLNTVEQTGQRQADLRLLAQLGKDLHP